MQGREFISQFRPISLCTVLYKILMKTIANRLRLVMPYIVSQNQTSFVARRNILENIIIAQEALRTMKTTKGQKHWMALKVDLEKAYDRVR